MHNSKLRNVKGVPFDIIRYMEGVTFLSWNMKGKGVGPRGVVPLPRSEAPIPVSLLIFGSGSLVGVLQASLPPGNVEVGRSFPLIKHL